MTVYTEKIQNGKQQRRCHVVTVPSDDLGVARCDFLLHWVHEHVGKPKRQLIDNKQTSKQKHNTTQNVTSKRKIHSADNQGSSATRHSPVAPFFFFVKVFIFLAKISSDLFASLHEELFFN